MNSNNGGTRLSWAQRSIGLLAVGMMVLGCAPAVAQPVFDDGLYTRPTATDLGPDTGRNPYTTKPRTIPKPQLPATKPESEQKKLRTRSRAEIETNKRTKKQSESEQKKLRTRSRAEIETNKRTKKQSATIVCRSFYGDIPLHHTVFCENHYNTAATIVCRSFYGDIPLHHTVFCENHYNTAATIVCRS
eukprot:Lankesteria_metandrocarpae@DN3588_c0_g1_i1.p1